MTSLGIGRYIATFQPDSRVRRENGPLCGCWFHENFRNLDMLVGMRVILVVLCLTPWSLFAQNTRYAGSGACQTCHPAVYSRWSKTRMANVVRNPKAHPDAIIPDLSKPDP